MELDSRNLHLVDHVTAHLKIFIQPAYANQVEFAVKQELDTHVLSFLEDQQAVLLGYRSVQVVSKQALLAAYIPYLTIECTAELLLFRPTIGNVLVGRVHSLSPGQLNVLVLGGINACVTEGELPEGFRFDMDHNCWVRHDDYSRAILMGDIVACKVLSAPVTDIDEEELLFNLDASLLSQSTGLLQHQPPIQRQRRAALQAAVAAEAAAAAASAARKESKQHEKAADKAARREAKEAAKAARKADKAAAKEAAKAQQKAAKRGQPEANGAGQPPAKRHKQSEQQEQQQQQIQPQVQQNQQHKQHQSGQLPQAGSALSAGSSSSSEQSPAQAQQQQQQEPPGKRSSKVKHKDKHRDKSDSKFNHRVKEKSSSKHKPAA